MKMIVRNGTPALIACVRWAAIAAVLLILSHSPSYAKSQTVNDLVSACMKGAAPDGGSGVNWGYCLGYIAGAADALDPDDRCIGARVNQGEIRTIVLRYLNTHPAVRNDGAAALVRAALVDAFGCQ